MKLCTEVLRHLGTGLLIPTWSLDLRQNFLFALLCGGWSLPLMTVRTVNIRRVGNKCFVVSGCHNGTLFISERKWCRYHQFVGTSSNVPLRMLSWAWVSLMDLDSYLSTKFGLNEISVSRGDVFIWSCTPLWCRQVSGTRCLHWRGSRYVSVMRPFQMNWNALSSRTHWF